MDSIAELVSFVERFVSSITSFTNGIFDFMTYKFAVWNNITMFEVLLGAGVGIYLTAAITKWLIGIVT